MLVSKSSCSVGDVVSFKLVNGDEIVAKIVEIGDNEYVLERPCSVMPGSQGIALIQAMFSADTKYNINISKAHIIMFAPTVDQIVNHYIQITTGIQPVSKGGIIT